MCCSHRRQKGEIPLALPLFERVHECLCKRERCGQETEMSAGEVNDREAKPPRQHPVRLGGHLILRILSAREDDSLRVCSKRCEIKLHPWILAQLMLHPIPRIGQRIRIHMLTHSTL